MTLASLGAALALTGCVAAGVNTSPSDAGPTGMQTLQGASRYVLQPDGTNDADNSSDRQLPSAVEPHEVAQPANDESPVVPACACGKGFRQTGLASWYGKIFQGRRTASGERYDMHALTAAHRTLPLGACVRVTSLARMRSVVVRINDRGPFVRGRIIDLSYAAAEALGVRGAGSAQVRLEHIAPVRGADGARRCMELPASA
ncbi:septal ring lytic transglycosylase RlpA family protein [bacterium M00.F.Ca.ET.228.01.1.1]|nr:septal ring lytic transglycosylase RlpA family protein [bacterium M00.F.Ca.ET.228.01.1.1]TGR95709.1 septal ring lytic transglycosylase RlpA family protein [bacterium M00.F.Ca.ET.191.01.1.1]TGT96725.1 septal ring lytic transglycosylase RlpA family protein [bacterium M00.F.Ca.ET.155.01.1.1]